MTVPTYQRIAADLRERIKVGRLRPGMHVPSVRDLTGEYSVARATAAAALRLLRDEGLTEPHNGFADRVRFDETDLTVVSIQRGSRFRVRLATAEERETHGIGPGVAVVVGALGAKPLFWVGDRCEFTVA